MIHAHLTFTERRLPALVFAIALGAALIAAHTTALAEEKSTATHEERIVLYWQEAAKIAQLAGGLFRADCPCGAMLNPPPPKAPVEETSTAIRKEQFLNNTCDAAELAQHLSEIFELGRPDSDHRGIESIEVLEESNELLVTGTEQGLAFVRDLIYPPPSWPEPSPDGRQLHVIPLYHAAAAEIVAKLRSMTNAELLADVDTNSILVNATPEELTALCLFLCLLDRASAD